MTVLTLDHGSNINKHNKRNNHTHGNRVGELHASMNGHVPKRRCRTMEAA